MDFATYSSDVFSIPELQCFHLQRNCGNWLRHLYCSRFILHFSCLDDVLLLIQKVDQVDVSNFIFCYGPNGGNHCESETRQFNVCNARNVRKLLLSYYGLHSHNDLHFILWILFVYVFTFTAILDRDLLTLLRKLKVWRNRETWAFFGINLSNSCRFDQNKYQPVNNYCCGFAIL